MKKWIKPVIAIVVILAALSFVKDFAIKSAVESGTEVVTGLKLRVGSLGVGIVRTVVDIKDLKIYNPKGYNDKVMLDMPRIYVNYDLPKILSGTIYLRDVKIDMKEFVVIKNEKGELNLDSLKVVKNEKEGTKPVEAEKSKAPKIHIDKLDLKIGKVVYKDYSKGGEPSVQEFNVNLNESYSNIDDPYSLVSLIVVKALMNTSIAKLTNFDVNGLSDTVTNTLSTANETTKEVAKEAGEAAKNAAETVKNMLPFGKK